MPFIAWLDANPNGYVINSERAGAGFVMLHRATCNFIRKWPPFIGRPTTNSARYPLTSLKTGSPAHRQPCSPLQGPGYELLALMLSPGQ
jgi:hypothetical protein